MGEIKCKFKFFKQMLNFIHFKILFTYYIHFYNNNSAGKERNSYLGLVVFAIDDLFIQTKMFRIFAVQFATDATEWTL